MNPFLGAKGGGSPADSAILVVPRGYAYYVGWAVFLIFSSFAILFAIFSGHPLVFGVGFGLFALLGAALLLMARSERCVVADSHGVRLVVGTRLHREIPWGEIREVKYGTRRIMTASETFRVGPFLQVRGRRFRQRINFDNEGFALSDDDLANFAAAVARTARGKGLPVVLVEAGRR